MFGRLAFACIVAAATAGTALADCTPKKSTADNYGVAGLGAATAARMDKLAKRTAECNFVTDQTCTYLDRNSISYDFVDDFIDVKSMQLSDGPAGAPLPWGLLRTDKPAIAIGKVQKLFGVAFLAADPSQSGLRQTGECLITPGGVHYWIWLEFDSKSRLKALGTRMIGVRD